MSERISIVAVSNHSVGGFQPAFEKAEQNDGLSFLLVANQSLKTFKAYPA